jgi:hypothetical protein
MPSEDPFVQLLPFDFNPNVIFYALQSLLIFALPVLPFATLLQTSRISRAPKLFLMQFRISKKKHATPLLI